jgi:calcium-dependent protein kinase
VLKREIQILKEVKHPNIIALIDVFEDAKYLHLVTELCTGGELFDRIIAKTQSAEGHFSEHDAAQLVKDILDAIAYCHDIKGIVHRDLKPENFLFLTESEDAPIKIIDFGLSRHDNAEGIMKTKVGTPYYVAPEVLRREYTKSCDIWSIGVITYILLCGYPPFYGDSDAEIFDSVRTGKFDFPSPEWDDISATAKEFVRYLLQKDPRERPTALQAMNHRWIQMHVSVDGKVSEKPSLLRNTDRGTTFQKFLAMQKLKKAALLAIASNLTQAEVGSLGDIFCRIDQSGDGVMTLTELDDAISRGSFPQEIQADISSLKEELRLSDTDTFSWKAFLAATMDKSLVIREDKIKFAFDHFKHSDTDYLTLEDFVAMFKSEAQAKEIFVFLDSDCDGKVSFEDFRNAMEENIEIENEE